MREAVILLAVAVLGSAALAARQPARAPAVAQRACRVVIDSTGREGLFQRVPMPSGGSDYEAYVGGGVYGHCENEPTTTMQADSLAWYPQRNEAHFVANVHFRDSTAVLDADRLTYFVRQERLFAEGNVYTRNLRTRSELRGPNLEYRRARPGVRDTAEMFADRRPTIRFFPTRDAARATPHGDSARADSTEPFVVVADRARMRGNDQMWAGGSVTVDRSDLAARGDSAMLDLAADRGLLLGGPPSVAGKGENEYRLTGSRISFSLGEQHELRRVLSSGAADAVGPDWHLRADTLDLALDSNRIQRTQAWGRTRRPDAVSGTYTITADSLDMHMPGQVMREVWAFGRSRATTRPDSSVLEDDWMTGDTLHAVFAPRDSAAQDTTGRRQQELRRLTSFGSARSLYHVVDEQRRGDPPGVNYSRGQRIEIALLAGKVSTVDVVGQVDGVYLEPIPRRASDSTAVAPPSGDTAAIARPVAPDTSRAAAPVVDSARVQPPRRDSTAARPASTAARDSARVAPPRIAPRNTTRTPRRPAADTARPRPRPVRPALHP